MFSSFFLKDIYERIVLGIRFQSKGAVKEKERMPLYIDFFETARVLQGG